MENNIKDKGIVLDLRFKEAWFALYDVGSRFFYNHLLKEKNYYKDEENFVGWIPDVKILQIAPIGNNKVFVQLIREEDYKKYNQDDANKEDWKNGKERILDDIKQARSIVSGTEEEHLLGVIATYVKQVCNDSSLTDEFKDNLKASLSRWENIILNKNEMDYLVRGGLLESIDKESYGDTDNNPLIINGLYSLILNDLNNKTIGYYYEKMHTSEKSKIKEYVNN